MKLNSYFYDANISTAMQMWTQGWTISTTTTNYFSLNSWFNVFFRDPVQLNLLYEQAKEAILEGTHPVRLEDAIQFAALQVQIQFGDHKEDKHKVGMLAEWVKTFIFV